MVEDGPRLACRSNQREFLVAVGATVDGTPWRPRTHTRHMIAGRDDAMLLSNDLRREFRIPPDHRTGRMAQELAEGFEVAAVAEELAGEGLLWLRHYISSRRAAQGDPQPASIKRPADIATIATQILRTARRERLIVVILDSGHRLLRVVPISEGSVDRSLLPVREVLNAVLRNDGKAFAVAHNHPSGDPTPSDADHRVTRELCTAAKTVGLTFLDHVVVSDTSWERVAYS